MTCFFFNCQPGLSKISELFCVKISAVNRCYQLGTIYKQLGIFFAIENFEKILKDLLKSKREFNQNLVKDNNFFQLL